MAETNEIPNVRVFDSSQRFLDRYTVVWSDLTFISMSADGKVYEGDDFVHETSLQSWLRNLGAVQIPFQALPEACKEKVYRDSAEACE